MKGVVRMQRRQHRVPVSSGLLAFILFLICLWAAGGASRDDVAGQVVVRTVSWLILIGLALLAPTNGRRGGVAVPVLLFASLGLVLLQLVPLPPDLWLSLPGRAAFAAADDFSGLRSWRPIAIVPSAAINAAGALIVPVATYGLMKLIARSEDDRLLGTILALVMAAAVVGVAQFAGLALNDPFVNSGGEPSSVFANRNHFALFLAIGCLLAPVWALKHDNVVVWRIFVAAAITPLFLLLILASGSRAGMLVGLLAMIGGVAMVWRAGGLSTLALPRWAIPAIGAGFALLLLLLVALSYGGNRAVGIDRLLSASVEGDMRRRGLGTVLAMMAQYFPLGSGFGGFDPLFRLHEPYNLLKPTYFNHAHNDFLEVVLDGGLPAAIILAAAALWWARRSFVAWRSISIDRLPAAGSTIIFLVGVASVFDYPARTPMVMALLVIAAVWLSGGPESETISSTAV